MGEFHIRVHACDVVRLVVDSSAGGFAGARVAVARHVGNCRGCASFVAGAVRVRAIVRRAVATEPVPEGLRLSVRGLIRDGVEAS